MPRLRATEDDMSAQPVLVADAGRAMSTDFYFGLWLGLALGIAYGLFLFL
jgi:hypothetical protein